MSEDLIQETQRTAAAPRGAGWGNLWKWLPAALAIPVALVYLVYAAAPAVSVSHDDGIYLVTAKSLAEGKGYRIQSLPYEAPQTKYPILFPALLAGLWKLNPDFPENTFIFKAIPIGGVLATAWLMLVMGRKIGLSEAGARWAALGWAASPTVFFHGTTILPDSLFSACCLAVILLLERAWREEGESRGTIRDAVLAGVLTATAFLIRSLGITLVPLVLMLVWKRKWRAAGGFLLAAGLLLMPWLVYQIGQPASTDPVGSYYTKLSYAEGHILALKSVRQISEVVAVNVGFQLVSPGVMMGLRTGSSAYLPGIALSLIALSGIAGAWRSGARLLVCWTVLYTGGLLLWVWPPGRYLTPALCGILLFAGMRMESMIRAKGLAKPIAIALLVAGTVMMARTNGRMALETRGNRWAAAAPRMAESWESTQAALAWIGANTPEDAVIGANLDPMVYLYTGRKAIRLFSWTPFDLFYDRDPGRRPLGGPERLRQHLIRHGISYLLLTPMPYFRESSFLRENLTEIVRRYPGSIRAVPGFFRPGYGVFEVRQELLQGSPTAQTLKFPPITPTTE